jgi:predicted DNA-binding transcriptional regulator AlpA
MASDVSTEQELALTAQECAPLIGVTASTLWRMAERGLVPCLRTGVAGRGLRFIPSEVRAALRARPAWTDPASHTRGKRDNPAA